MWTSLALGAFTLLCSHHRIHLHNFFSRKVGFFLLFFSLCNLILESFSLFYPTVLFLLRRCSLWSSSVDIGCLCTAVLHIVRAAWGSGQLPPWSSKPPALVLAGFAAPSCPTCPPLLHLPFQCPPFAVFSPMPLSCSSRLPFPASSALDPLHQYYLGSVPSEFKVLASSPNN